MRTLGADQSSCISDENEANQAIIALNSANRQDDAANQHADQLQAVHYSILQRIGIVVCGF